MTEPKPLEEVSRARRYQLRHAAAGLCEICTSKAIGTKGLCFRHTFFYHLRKRGLTKGRMNKLNSTRREKLAAILAGRYSAIRGGFLAVPNDEQRLLDAQELRVRLKVLWGGVLGLRKLAAVMKTLDKMADKERKNGTTPADQSV